MTRNRIPDRNTHRPVVQGARCLRVGEVVEVACTDLIAKTGQAVGRAAGSAVVVYVLGPLPGEHARVRIDSVKANYAVAQLLELVGRSQDRVEPFCAVFGTCGGCTVQHLAYPAQLAWKRGIVAEALRRIGGIEAASVAFPVGMREPRAYRNKMALVVDHHNGEAHFGFYAMRSHDVVPVDTCPIVVPQLDQTLRNLWSVASDAETQRAFQEAAHVIVRAGRDDTPAKHDASIVAITTKRASKSVRGLGAALAGRLPGTKGITNSFDPRSHNAVLGSKHAVVYGSPTVCERIAGVSFSVSAASFFQINSEMVGRIFTFLEPLVSGTRRIVDLYCGAGTFALFFASRGADVVGIEENPHAVKEALGNAARNAVKEKTRFIGGRVDAVLRTSPGARALAAADVVFIDPPRKGSDEATLAALAGSRVPHIWYLSCNPATLARDLAYLLPHGYRVGCVQPFDMFPQTGHIEVLVLVHRADVEALACSFREDAA